MTREQAINYLISCGFTNEQVGEVVRALTYEPTTKNDLGVDCISRQAVEDAMYDATRSMDLNYGQIMEYIDNLPSVTPQLSVSEVTALAEWTEKLTKASEDAYNKGYADGMKEQEPRWIPVSERLPDTDDEVLCWYEYYHWSQKKVLPEYGLGRYLKETSAWFGEVASGHEVRVIAWMPLPKAYREVEE